MTQTDPNGIEYNTLTYNPAETDDGDINAPQLKMSKSSFMQYNMCPRKFWWNYIGLPDVKPPATDAMLRGSSIHRSMEPLVFGPNDARQIKEANEIAADELGDDTGFEVMKEMLSELEDTIGKWTVLSAEVKLTVYDERKDIWLVGALDGLIQTEDGDVILVELKSGNFNDGKLSRTRRELAYYSYMLNLIPGFPIPTHFLYIAPDATNEKFLTKVMGQKKKIVGAGLAHGMYMLEPVSLRTINAFMKVYDRTVDSLKAETFPIKWNDYFCTQYCDYVVQCEPETMGLCEDPTTTL